MRMEMLNRPIYGQHRDPSEGGADGAGGSKAAQGAQGTPGVASNKPTDDILSHDVLQIAEAELASVENAPKDERARAMHNLLSGLEVWVGEAYEMHEYKGSEFGWSWKEEVAKAHAALDAKAQQPEGLRWKDLHAVLVALLRTTRDYHVSVRLRTDERATLPLTIRGVDDGPNGFRCFIGEVNRSQLGQDTFPFGPGTEVVAFNGRRINDVLADLEKELGVNLPFTSRAQALRLLTERVAARGWDVPKDAPTITVKDAAGKEHTRQIIWRYTPDAFPGDVGPRRGAQSPQLAARLAKQCPKRGGIDLSVLRSYARSIAADHDRLRKAIEFITSSEMVLASWDPRPPQAANSPFDLGAKRSYIPRIREPLIEAKPDDLFDWYIYENEAGKKVGYVRIPSFAPDDPEACAFAFRDLISMMRNYADGLIIDERDNPGGYVSLVYTYASMLSDEPQATPRHRMKITDDLRENAKALLSLSSLWEDGKYGQRVLESLFGKTIMGYPVGPQFGQFVKKYARDILDAHEQGLTSTPPLHLSGMDYINPYPNPSNDNTGQPVQDGGVLAYTGPIMVLQSEECYSGGDFFPAILQDNREGTAKPQMRWSDSSSEDVLEMLRNDDRRIHIVGSNTAGAGGYIARIAVGVLGIESIVVTGSIAVRPDGTPLENVGVREDITLLPTFRDLQNGYRPYADALGAIMNAKLEGWEKLKAV